MTVMSAVLLASERLVGRVGGPHLVAVRPGHHGRVRVRRRRANGRQQLVVAVDPVPRHAHVVGRGIPAEVDVDRCSSARRSGCPEAVGGSVSGRVTVAVSGLLKAETLPAASSARTSYVCVAGAITLSE